MIDETTTILGLGTYYLGKIIDKAFIDNGYNGIKGLFMFKKTYKTELNKVLLETIDEFEKHNSRSEPEKIVFYQSAILFDALSEFFLFKEDNVEIIADQFDVNPKILRPTDEEIKDFYSLFLQNIQKNKKLKKLFVEENYQQEIFEQTEKLSQILRKNDEILQRVSNIERKLDKIAFLRVSKKFESSLQIEDFYVNQGLDVYHKLEKYSPRQKVTDKILEFLNASAWVNVYGNISMGKTQLAVLASETFADSFWVELKNFEGHQVVAIILNELKGYFSAGNLDIEVEALVDLIPTGSVVILDDLPKLQLSKKDLHLFIRLLSSLKAKSIKLLSTSNFNITRNVVDHFADLKEYNVPFLDIDEIGEIIQSFGGNEIHQNALSKAILTISSGHPAIVVAINRFLAESEWNIQQQQLEDLFSGNYDVELETDIYEKLLKTVTDSEARELLYRLKMILGKITSAEIAVVASVAPIIQYPDEKIIKLAGLWLQKPKSGTFEISPLVRKIKVSLSSDVSTEISIKLGSQILGRKKLNQLDAYRAIWYFITGDDANQAGFVLTIVLNSAQDNPNLYFDWGFDAFWTTSALPASMDVYLKAIVRLFQINLFKIQGKSIDFLITDSEGILRQAAVESVNIAPLAFQLTMYFSDKNSKKSNEYLTLALAQMKELGDTDSFGEMSDIPLNAEMLIWNNLLGVRKVDEFTAWVELLSSMEPERIRASQQGDLHYATSFIFCSNIFDDEKNKENPKWDILISFFDVIIEACKGINGLFLLPLAIKNKIKILMVHLSKFDEAKSVYDEAIQFLSDAEVKEFHFFIKDEYGRQLSYLGNLDEALPILLQAEAIETPIILTDKIYTYLALNEILISTDPKRALGFMEKAVELQEGNPFVTDVESAKIFGEYSISLWKNNEQLKSIYAIERGMDKVINSYVPQDEYKATIIWLGHVLNYYHHLFNNMPPPKTAGDDYMVPFVGMFYRPHDNLLNSGFYFEQRKFMQAYLMLQSFSSLADLERSKKWARITFKLFDEEPYNPFKQVMMRETAFFILDGDYEGAISHGHKLMSAEEEQNIAKAFDQLPEAIRKIIDKRVAQNFDNIDIYLFEYIFIYIIIKMLDNYVKSKNKETITNFIEYLPKIRDHFTDPKPIGWLETALTYLLDDSKTGHEILDIEHDNEDLSNSIKILLYLTASFKANLFEALKLHLSLIARLEMVSTTVAGISNYYFIVIPFLTNFWTHAIKNNPGAFENHSFLLEKGLPKIESEIVTKKLKTLFKVLVHHLNYDPTANEQNWLDS